MLLHGTPLTPEVWSGVAAILGADAEVVCPSVRLDEGEDTSGLAARVMTGLPGAETIHLVGHSFGGQVALELALRVPERISTLTLVCSRDTPYPAFRSAAASVRRGDPVDVEGTLRRWFRADELVQDDPVVTYARDCLLTVDRPSWARSLDAIAEFDRAASVTGLDLPTHLMAAEHDGVSTVAAMTSMAERLPRSHLTVLPGAAHMSMFLRPGGLAESLAVGGTPEP